MNTNRILKEKNQINIVLHDAKASNLKSVKKLENSPLNVIDHYFQSFVGLHTIKKRLKEIYAVKLINDERQKNGLPAEKQVLHMIFKGNPGTGKTNVARKIASLFYDLNILTKGHFIEAERADLVGEYIGQTALKTRNLIQRALGGVLFIDEAYSLARGGEKDFGREAIDTLVKHMEDYKNDFILILAGYPNEMDYFLEMNPGLASRFPFIHTFDDYTIEELVSIAENFLHDRQYRLTNEAKWKLKHHLRKQLLRKEPHFANARYVRNIVEKAIRAQSVRLVNAGKFAYNDLIYIDVDDLDID